MRLLLGCIFLLAVQYSVAQEEEVSVLGQIYPSFDLSSVNTAPIHLAQQEYKFVALVFVCNHCPMAKLYWDRINDAYLACLPKHVLVVAVNPMDTLVYKEESFAEMRKRVRASKLQVPYVQDGSQQLSKMLHVPHTPHVVLLANEGEQWRVVYEGAFDDNGAHAKAATPFLMNAINESLEGKNITTPKTSSFGCRVYYREP